MKIRPTKTAETSLNLFDSFFVHLRTLFILKFKCIEYAHFIANLIMLYFKAKILATMKTPFLNHITMVNPISQLGRYLSPLRARFVPRDVAVELSCPRTTMSAKTG